MPERKIQVEITGQNVAQPAFGQLNRDLTRTGQTADQASAKLGGVSRAASGLGSALGNLASQTIAFAGGLLLQQALVSTLDKARQIAIGFNSTIEQSAIAWETLLKNERLAQAYLLDLQRTALRLGIDFEQMNAGTRVLLNMGVAAKDVKDLYLDIKAVAAGVGRQDAAERITYAIGQMLAKGRVSAEEMTQQMGELLPAWQILADYIGKSVQETQKLAEAGQILPQTFVEAFRAYAQTNYAGMLERQARTFEGAMSRLNTAAQIAGGTAFEPFFRRLRDLANAVADFVASDRFQEWALDVAARVDVALNAFGALASGVADALGAVLTTVLNLGQAIYEALSWLDPWATHSPSLVERVQTGGEAITQAYEDMGRGVESSLGGASTAVEGFKAKAEELSDLARAQKREFDELREALNRAQASVRDWTQTPIKGTAEYQRRLRAVQYEIDKVSLALIKARREGASHRLVAALEKQLDTLRDKAEEIRLDERLKLGPLRDKIEDLQRPAEAPFEAIVKGIKEGQAEINRLTPLVAKAESAYENIQRRYEDAAEAARDFGKGAGAATTSVNTLKDRTAGLADKLADADKRLKDFQDNLTRKRAEVEKAFEPYQQAIENNLLAPLRKLKEQGLTVTADDVGRWLGGMAGEVGSWIDKNGPAVEAQFARLAGMATKWLADFWGGNAGTTGGGSRKNVDAMVTDLEKAIRERGPDVAEKVGGWAGQFAAGAIVAAGAFVAGLAAWLGGGGDRQVQQVGQDIAGAFVKGFQEGLTAGMRGIKIPFGPYDLLLDKFLAGLPDYMGNKMNLFDLLGRSMVRSGPLAGQQATNVVGSPLPPDQQPAVSFGPNTVKELDAVVKAFDAVPVSVEAARNAFETSADRIVEAADGMEREMGREVEQTTGHLMTLEKKAEYSRVTTQTVFKRLGDTLDTAFRGIADSIGRGIEALADWARAVANTPGITASTVTPTPTGLRSGRWEARAGGGRVEPGRGYLVGEDGPEPFFPDLPGVILPNRALAGVGGMTLHYHQNAPLIGTAEIGEKVDLEYVLKRSSQYMDRDLRNFVRQWGRAPLGMTSRM